jgi:predicted transcriptional regulator
LADTKQWLEPTVAVVASFVDRNQVDAVLVPDLIRSVSRAFRGLHRPEPEPEAETQTRKATAAQIRKSITDDGLISFEDGRSYRVLKRHLRTLNLTPDEYRAKWGLGSGYPMTAPSYSVKRSILAKASGLGRVRPELEPVRPKRGRPRKIT